MHRPSGVVVIHRSTRDHPTRLAAGDDAVLSLVRLARLDGAAHTLEPLLAIVRMDSVVQRLPRSEAVLVEGNTGHALKIGIAVHAVGHHVPVVHAHLSDT